MIDRHIYHLLQILEKRVQNEMVSVVAALCGWLVARFFTKVLMSSFFKCDPNLRTRLTCEKRNKYDARRRKKVINELDLERAGGSPTFICTDETNTRRIVPGG